MHSLRNSSLRPPALSSHTTPRPRPDYPQQRQPSIASASSHRLFSSSCTRWAGHYQTLNIPQNATRNQIKASFYKLSKQYHPDVNNDPSAKEKFQAVSEAYAVLGDERKRRAYDRSLASTSGSTTSHPFSSSAESTHPHYSYEGRRRGATHAWGEYARRPNTGPRSYTHPHPPPHYSHYAHNAHSAYQQGQPGPNPFTNPNVQRATGRRGPLPTDRGPTAADHIARESWLVRIGTVSVLVFLMAAIGHGLSASA